MFVRIARFEGLDTSGIDEQAAEMRRQIESARAGDVPAEIADQIEKLRGTVKRFYQLVDRETGTALGVVFCETEDDLRQADAALNEMSPGDEQGRRTGVETYEVVLDQSFS